MSRSIRPIDYNRISLFSAADYGVTVSYARKLPLDGFNYGINAKVIRRVIGEFANSWGFGFDLGIQYQTKNEWMIGLMLRDITTTYNVWNIDEDAYEDIANAIPGENQELPETSEITLPKAQLGFAKKFTIKNDYSILAAANLNMQFAETNDIVSTEFVSIKPLIAQQDGIEVIGNGLCLFLREVEHLLIHVTVIIHIGIDKILIRAGGDKILQVAFYEFPIEIWGVKIKGAKVVYHIKVSGRVINPYCRMPEY